MQAAIVAVQSEPPRAESTDWARIVRLYDELLGLEASPVVALNRAVGIAMRDGPEAGLALIRPMLEAAPLARYYLTHAAHAELCRRCSQLDEARASDEAALALAVQEPERRHLRRRLKRLEGG